MKDFPQNLPVIRGNLTGRKIAVSNLNIIMDTQFNSAHEEGELANSIEEQTAKLPFDVFLWSAIGIIAVSLGLQISRKKNVSLFVGQWVAPLLLLGVYNKLVKQQRHDSIDKGGQSQKRRQSAASRSFSAMS